MEMEMTPQTAELYFLRNPHKDPPDGAGEHKKVVLLNKMG